jgi:hypothetical protein
MKARYGDERELRRMYNEARKSWADGADRRQRKTGKDDNP